jgi:glutathione peroxidase
MSRLFWNRMSLMSDIKILGLCLLVGTTTGLSSAKAASADFFQIPVVTIEGKKTTLAAYKKNVLLVVNTASQCGYTPQYSGLQKLYAKYKDQGFVVLGFPSNDFGKQEPGKNSEIKIFCKGNYHVEFPLFEKGSVGGKEIQPVYSFLLQDTSDHSPVKWNFEKFLIGRDGVVQKRFRSDVAPDSAELTQSIEAALKAPVLAIRK